MARKRAKADSRPRFVLDCSIVLAWYFADEADPYADAVAKALAKATAIVPSLFHLELANILVVGERRGRSTEAQATAFLKRVAGLPIEVDSETTAHAWSETIGLARTHGLSAYDAAYLELALRESVPLATLDDLLASAVKTFGIEAFKA
jgi:predicted nucleic acid-binding protein